MSTFEQSEKEIVRALLRELKAGVDVGELLVHAVVSANARAVKEEGRHLISNRSGSWEANHVRNMYLGGTGDEIEDTAFKDFG